MARSQPHRFRRLAFQAAAAALTATGLLAAGTVLGPAAPAWARAAAAPSAAVTPPPTQATRLFDLNGIAKALQVARAFQGRAAAAWTPVRGAAEQAKLVQRLPRLQADLARIPELWGFAARSADAINQALAKAGFGIRLPPWREDGETFGVAALLKVQVQWNLPAATHEPGDKHPFTVAGNRAAFRVDTKQGVLFGEFPGTREPVIILPTKSGDTVFLLRTDRPPTNAVAMADLATAIGNTRAAANERYAGADLPMVSADEQLDLAWLSGLRSGRWQVGLGLQQIRFKMDELGATAETGTAVMLVTGPPPPEHPVYYKLDGPFMAVIVRPGVATPIFNGYIALDSFRRPR